MTTNASNPTPLPPTPPSPIDEGDFLALIEGISIPAERAARVREALATDPRLAELAALMRADREAVASLPAVSAPSDLLDRVEAQLEREALVGLAQNERAAMNDSLPISTVIPARKVWMTRRTGAPLAAAAAVALIAGGVLMMIPGKKPVIAPPSPPVGPLANNDKPPADSPLGTSLVHNTNTATDPGITADPAPANTVPKGPELAAKPDAPETPVPNTPVVAKAAPAISSEALLLAANEGRLMLRVRAEDLVVKGKVDQVNANARSMRVDPLDTPHSSLVSQTLAGAIASRKSVPPAAPVKPAPLPEAAPIAAGDPNASKPAVPPTAVVTEPPPPIAPVEVTPVLSQKAYLAPVPSAAESLESLRRSLSTDASPAEWVVLTHALTFEPPTDAASILWWTSQPAAWSIRVTVPVVVQHN